MNEEDLYESHTQVFEKTFVDLDDAQYYLETQIRDNGIEWMLVEGSGLRYVNYQWQVFIILKRI